MAITRYAGDRFVVDAGDTKPTGVLDGAFLVDTGNLASWVLTPTGWSPIAGGGGGGGSTSPGGSNTQVQFNNAGAFGGDADLTFTNGNQLNVNKLSIAGNVIDSNTWIGENGMVLTNEGATGVNWKSIESVLSGVGGSGVANYVARWSDEDTLTTGIIYDNASKVGISTASPQAELHVYAGTTAGDHLLVESTNTAAGDAPDLVLYRNSPSPANSDDLGIIRFRGKNNGADTGFGENKVIYADIEAEITSVVSGAEGAALKFYTQDNGSLASRMVITGVNVGIGTNSPGATLDITGDNSSSVMIANQAGAGYIFIGKQDNTNRFRIGAKGDTVIDSAYNNGGTSLTVNHGGGSSSYAASFSGGNVGIGTATPAVPLHITKSAVGDNEVPEVIRLSTLNSASPSWSTTDGLCIGAEMKKADATTITKQPIKFRYDGGDMATTLEEGKVGIGTNAPAAKLDLRSSDSVVAYIIRPSASPTVHIGSATSAGAQLGYVHADDYAFYGHDAAYNAIVVNSSGSVGIGSTDPEEIVNVASAGAVTPGVIHDLYSATTTRFPWIGLRKSGSNTKGTVAATEDGDILGKIVFKGVDSGSSFFRESASIIATASGAPDADTQPGMLQFATSNTTSNSVKMTITSSGFVGIGTVTPVYTLQANGTNGGIIGVTRTTGNTTGVLGHLRFGNTDVDSDLANIEGVQDGATDSARLEFQTQATGGSATTHLTLKSDGVVDINSAKLKINGGSGTDGQVLTTDGAGGIAWETSPGAGSVDGSGTANYIPKWTDSDTIGNSTIYTDGQDVAIGSTAFGVGGTIDLSIGNPGSTAGGITLWNTTSGVHSIGFGDANSGTARYEGYLEYSHADNSMRFGTLHAERMRINNLGYVGINTTTPAIYLHSHGSALIGRTSGTTGGYTLSSYDLVLSNGSSGTVILLYNSAGAFQSSLIKYDTNCLKLGLNNSSTANAIWTTTAVNVGSVGVGIGTVTPGGLLEVYAAAGLVASHVKSGTVISRLTANSSASDAVVGTSSAHDFLIQRAGSTRMTFSGSSVVVNDSGEDIDFRVEGDTDTNLIRTDAANERVGIGTNAPSSKLHVNSEISCGADDNNRAMFGYTPSRFYLGTRQSGTNYLNTVSVTSGKVGIGTNSPSTEGLEIAKPSADTTFNVNDQADSILVLRNSDDGSINTGRFAAIQMKINSSSAAAEGTIRTQFAGDGDADLIFSTTKAGTGADRMVIDEDGYVGIGTNAPSCLLQLGTTSVQGNAHLSARFNGDSINFGHANGAGYGSVIGCSVNNGYPHLGFMCEAGTNDNTFRTRGLKGNVIYTNTSGALNFAQITTATADNQAPTDRVTILSGGNVGIGTVTPGAPLHIFSNGSANTQQTVLCLGSNTSNRPSLQFSENQNAGFDTGMSIEYRGDFGAGGANGLAINGLGADATTSGAAIATFLSGGNVGIGTTNPAALLNLFKTGTNDAVSSAIYLQRAAGNYGCAILQVGNGSSGYEKLMFTAGHNSDPMAISNAKMTIQHDGNVGIGTTSPSVELVAIGNVIFRHDTNSPAGYASGTDLAVFGSHNSTGTLFEVFTQGDVSRLKILGSGATTVNGDLNFGTMGQYLTFYGGGETEHSISSRNSSGNAADDLRINTFGALFINLDSNNNNTSGADFSIGRHGQTGALSDWLLDLSGETGKLQLNKYGSGTHTGTLAKSLGVDSSGNIIEFTGGTGTVTGSGTTNYVPKFTSSTALGNSALYDGGGSNIGIGTNNPYYALDVRFTNSATSFSGGSSGNWGGSGLRLQNASTTAGAMALIQFRTSTTEWFIGNKFISSSPDKSDFIFNHEDSEKVRFTNDGKVGIGTNAPSEVLQVKGNIIIRGETNNRLKIANDSNNNWAEIGNDGATGENTLEFFTGSSSTSSLSITNGGYAAFAYASQVRLTLGSTGTAGTNDANWIRSNGANLEFNAASGDFNWEVGGAHKMRLTDSGVLGVGLGSGTDPFGTIHANGTNGGIFQLTRTSGGTTSTLGIVRFGNTNIDSNLINIEGIQDGATDSARLEFQTQPTGGATVTRMTIKSDGLVGIGLSPTANFGTLQVYATGNHTNEQNAAFTIGDNATGGMRIYGGVNNSDNYSFIGSVESGTAYRPLALQPNGSHVGIGTTGPQVLLDVYTTGTDIARFETTSTDHGRISIRSGTAGDAQIRFQNAAASKWSIGNDGGDSNKFKIAVGSGAFAASEAVIVDTSGNLSILGTLTEASSLALKENIEDFTPSLDIINKIRPVKYNKKKESKKEIGLIAEELAELFPELVDRDNEGNPSGVNYSRAVTVLLGGFKELYKEIEQLKKRI